MGRIVVINKQLIVFVLVLLGGTIGSAQGLLLNSKKLNQMPKQAKLFGGPADQSDTIVSLKKYCPPITDQDIESTCVGHASAGAMSVAYAFRDKVTANDVTVFSEDYVYFNSIEDPSDIEACKKGAQMDRAMVTLKDKGDCKKTDYDNSACTGTPPKDIDAFANQFKVKEALLIVNKYSSRGDGYSNGEVTKIVRNKLMSGFPVVIGLKLTESFNLLKNGGGDTWHPTINNEFLGHHAMVIVGFDDFKRTFELRNSWGTSFGNDGYCYIDYDDLEEQIYFGFIIVPFEKPANKGKMEGSFTLRTAQKYLKYGEPYLKTTDIKLSGTDGVYSTDKRFISLATETAGNRATNLQLVADSTTAKKYIYIFSVDSEGIGRINFPTDEADEEITNDWSPTPGLVNREIPLITSINDAIIYPDEDSGFCFEKSGEENIVVLYSEKPIKDLKDRIRTYILTDGDAKVKINAAFKNMLVPNSNIEWENNSDISFSIKKYDSGYVVPVIIKLNAD